MNEEKNIIDNLRTMNKYMKASMNNKEKELEKVDNKYFKKE